MFNSSGPAALPLTTHSKASLGASTHFSKVAPPGTTLVAVRQIALTRSAIISPQVYLGFVSGTPVALAASGFARSAQAWAIAKSFFLSSMLVARSASSTHSRAHSMYAVTGINLSPLEEILESTQTQIPGFCQEIGHS